MLMRQEKYVFVFLIKTKRNYVKRYVKSYFLKNLSLQNRKKNETKLCPEYWTNDNWKENRNRIKHEKDTDPTVGLHTTDLSIL